MKTLRNFLILSIAVLGFSFVNVHAQDAAADETVDTARLQKQVYKEILKMPYYGLFDSIGFEIDGDTVILTGKVYNGINQKSAAKRIAKLDGVGNVVNNIEILPPSGFDDRIRVRTAREFANGGSLYRYIIGTNPSVRIIVDRGHLTLEGFVSNEGDARLANILAQGVPGVFSVTNNLIVTKGKPY